MLPQSIFRRAVLPHFLQDPIMSQDYLTFITMARPFLFLLSNPQGQTERISDGRRQAQDDQGQSGEIS